MAIASKQSVAAAAIGLVAAALSVYVWHVTSKPGHLMAGAGFLILGLAWGRRPAIAWIGALLILGGSILRWVA
jgi:hypothetical protein